MSSPTKKLNSFAYVSGEMYAKYAARSGESSPNCVYYLSLFPDNILHPKEYAAYKAEFEAGKKAQEKILKEKKKA